MTLAQLIKLGEDEIICDLAETYKIYDYKGMSPNLVATLVLGLSDDSRIKRKISGNKLSIEQMLMALMVDNLQFIAWSKTKAAAKNSNRPESLFKKLTGFDDKQKDELLSFTTPEEYEAHMQKLRGKNG